MTSTTLKVLTCDRCGRADEIRGGLKEDNWAHLNYSEYNSHRWIGSQRSQKVYHVDLCPTCSREVYDWFKQENHP